MTAVAGFARWWVGELRGLLPARMWEERRSQGRIVVDLDKGGLRLLVEKGRDLRPLGPAAPSAAGTLAGPADVMTGLAGHTDGLPVGIRLGMSDCYVRHVELPAAARAEFKRMLLLQLERISPFKPQDVYVAHYVAGPGTRPGTVAVKHLVAKRSLIDPLLRQCESAGTPAAFVDCWDEQRSAPLPIDFLATDRKAGPTPAWGQMALFAVLLAGLGVVIDTMQHEAALTRLTTETSALREQVRATQGVVDARSTQLREAQRIIAARIGRPSATEVLEEVSRLLPDSAVLQQLRLERDGVDISGMAASAVTLLPLFEQSPLFHDARLTAPVSIDVKDGRERFGIRLLLRRTDKPADRSAATGKPGGRM